MSYTIKISERRELPSDAFDEHLDDRIRELFGLPRGGRLEVLDGGSQIRHTEEGIGNHSSDYVEDSYATREMIEAVKTLRALDEKIKAWKKRNRR